MSRPAEPDEQEHRLQDPATQRGILSLDELLSRLDEAEELVRALRSGEVDALLVHAEDGDRVYTLSDAVRPYRSMIERMSEGAVTVDALGTILYCNRRFTELAGVPGEQLLGRRMDELVRPDGGIDLARLLDGEATARADFLLERADATRLPVTISSSPLAVDGVATSCLVVTDLTHQRHHERLQASEEALQRLNSELEERVRQRTEVAEHRTRQLRVLAARLTTAEQRERRRIAQLLHDHLQQILAGARMQLDAVRHQAAQAQLLDRLEQASSMIMDAIEASRSLTAQLAHPVLYSRGLPAALEWLVRHVESEHGQKVELLILGEPREIDDDLRGFLFQAARELLFNVVKHAGTGEARLELAFAPATVAVAVGDQGSGCDPLEVQDRPIDDDSFGLFSLRQRAQLLGGRFDMRCAVGRGCRVEIELPLEPLASEAAVDPAAERRSGDRASLPGRTTGGPLRVLLVDDHAILRQGLAAILEDEPHIEVVGEAADGDDAVRQARRLRPDVVVMDVSLPGRGGIEATRVITAELPHTRVVGLSMYEPAEMAEAMLAAGAASYLQKDGPSGELVAAILGGTDGR